jgi:hypothetical protein
MSISMPGVYVLAGSMSMSVAMPISLSMSMYMSMSIFLQHAHRHWHGYRQGHGRGQWAQLKEKLLILDSSDIALVLYRNRLEISIWWLVRWRNNRPCFSMSVPTYGTYYHLEYSVSNKKTCYCTCFVDKRVPLQCVITRTNNDKTSRI